MVYFDARELPDPTQEYVAWLDVMGIQSHMSYSVKVAANFIFKTHIAALDAPRDEIIVYPVMDGFYATTTSADDMKAFIGSTLASLSELFCNEAEPKFRFIVRGAVAFGAVYHGKDISDAASHTLASIPEYREAILLGTPIVDAHLLERSAPPFGIAVHESALDQGEFDSSPWKWWPLSNKKQRLVASLTRHYDWCAENAATIDYAEDRIAVHRDAASEYFGDS